MKTFATNEKKSLPAAGKTHPYVHHPVSRGTQAQQVQIRRILRSTGAQAKLTIGQPNDKYEQEADRVADQVMRMSDADVVQRAQTAKIQPIHIQRMCPECEEETAQRQPDVEEEFVQTKLNTGILQRQEDNEEDELVQTKQTAGATQQVSPAFESQINSFKSGGQSLDKETRNFFEPRFGKDFRDVRIHQNGQAADVSRSINARAFTLGNNVVFGSGQYQPGTSEGRKLLTHELTHTIQQSSGSIRRNFILSEPIIQRALACSLEHVNKECENAGKNCLSIQSEYCNKKYPKPADIKKLHANAIKGAEDKNKDFPHAAENLLHFLNATGIEKEMPTSIFENHKATKEQLLDVHREKFIAGAKKRLKSGEITVSKGASMVWTDTANAFSFLSKDDLGLAVGGYTLCSKVKVSLTNIGNGKFELSFDEWTVQAFDCYNWDPGKGIGLPGADDKDLCCLQNAGKGKHFRVKTKPWKNSYAPSIAKITIS